MKRTIVGAAVLLASLAALMGQASAQQPTAAGQRVYTVCTLLVGRRTARPTSGTAENALIRDGSTVTMFVDGPNPLTPKESVQVGKDLADLQEKLKTTFQLDQVEVVASLGDWMPVGREMLLHGESAGLKLLVTASGLAAGVEPPMVPTTPRDGGQPSDFERGYADAVMASSRAAQYQVKLTSGPRDVFDRSMRVRLGQRSVFARQPDAKGPVYFAVVATPLMETRQGVEAGGTIGKLQPITGPKLVSGPDPLLPPEVQARIKSSLIVRATIDADGTVRDVKVMQAVEGLTERVVSALRQRRYEPARDESGRAITVQIVVAIRPPDEP